MYNFLNIKTIADRIVFYLTIYCRCAEVLHIHVFFLWSFSKSSDKNNEKMDGGNCSSVTGFIFLGITENTEDKVTIFTMVLIVYLIGHLAKLGMIFLIKMDPQMHTPMYFFLSVTSPSVSSAISTAIDPKILWDPICQEQINPLLWLLLCNSWSSVSLPILSVSCWQCGLWAIQTCQQPLALCGQRVQQGVPCSWLGFTWWGWQMLWYTRH